KQRRRGHGEGTVYQKPDGRWCAQVRMGRDPLTGKLVRETVYGDSQKEVIEKARQKKEEAAQGLVTTASDMTLGLMLDFWLGHAQRTAREETALRYKQELAHLLPALGKTPIRDLSAYAITRTLQALAEQGVSTSKQRRALARLRQALGYAKQ